MTKQLFIGILILLSADLFAQERIDLIANLQSKKINAVNRIITQSVGYPGALEMDAANSDGLGILEGVTFENGIIEVELMGENNPGKSFIGIAFNVQNDSTYEAVYFRPFNFVATEQIRKDHMVQYIFHPEFTWRKLRTDRTGEFESEIMDPPNPDDWFKATIKITEEQVKVYVNDRSEPSLTVDRLIAAKSNKIALWTGFGSSGRYRSLALTEY